MHTEEVNQIGLRASVKLLSRFWRFVRPYKGKFFLTLCLVLLAVPLGQFALFLTRDITNRALTATGLTPEERWATVLHIVGLQIAFYLASASLSTWREVLEWYGGMRSTFDLRMVFYRHLHRLPLSFLNKRAPGEHLFRSTTDMVSMFLVKGRVAVPGAAGQAPPDSKEVAMTAYSNDVDPYDPGVMGMIVRTMPMLLETVYGLAWGAALLFLIDPILSLCLIAYIIPFTYFSNRMYNRIRVSAFLYKAATENEIAVLRDTLAGMRTVKSFGRLRRQLGKYSHAASEAKRRGIQQMAEMLLTQNVLQMGMKWTFSMGIYLYVTLRVMRGDATIGDWVATFLLIEAAQAPLENFVQLLQLIRMQLVPAQRILETLDVQPTLQDKPGAAKLPALSGSVEFRAVDFSYEPSRKALDGLNLRIEAGEYVGIVGPSGAGKSSLLALMLRLYAPDSGQVLVDGHDVGEIKLQTLLDQTGTVPQTTHLYSGTIAENILFGNPRATWAELEEATRLAGMTEFLARLPRGVDTEIGEAGSISGGERQRIGIARAMIRDPKILILDEATASLDPVTEEAVLRSVDQLRRDRTVLAVAHRLKAVMQCNRIVVMEAGRAVQVGTHTELVAQEGLYRTLWNEQMRDSASTDERVGGKA